MPLLPPKKEEKEDEKEEEKVEYTIYKKILLIVCQAFKLIKTWRESENPEDLPLDNVALDMIAKKRLGSTTWVMKLLMTSSLSLKPL
jgi:hypothetical protein